MRAWAIQRPTGVADPFSIRPQRELSWREVAVWTEANGWQHGNVREQRARLKSMGYRAIRVTVTVEPTPTGAKPEPKHATPARRGQKSARVGTTGGR